MCKSWIMRSEVVLQIYISLFVRRYISSIQSKTQGRRKRDVSFKILQSFV